MNDEKYAVSVRDGTELFLFMRIRRSPRGEFFAMLPRPHDTSINAHASLHADGQYHIKTDGLPKIMHQRKQRPDANLVGTEHLFDQGLTQSTARTIGQSCNPNDWSAVFEIPVTDLVGGSARRTHVTVDLVDPNSSPNLVPQARILGQARYRASSPFLVVTHYAFPLLP